MPSSWLAFHTHPTLYQYLDKYGTPLDLRGQRQSSIVFCYLTYRGRPTELRSTRGSFLPRPPDSPSSMV